MKNLLKDYIKENEDYRNFFWYKKRQHINARVIKFQEYLLQNETTSEDVGNMIINKESTLQLIEMLGYTNRYEIESAYETLFVLEEYLKLKEI